MRTIICAICGKEVKISGYARNVKYCEECAKEAKKPIKKKRGPKEDYCTSKEEAENINKCLNCALPECNVRSLGCLIYGKERNVL